MAAEVVSLTHEGSLKEYSTATLDVGDLSTDAQILSALSRETGATLAGFVVDRTSATVIKVRPQATFGL